MPDQTISSTNTQCDFTEEQARNYELSGTSTSNIDMSGLTATINSTTACSKK